VTPFAYVDRVVATYRRHHANMSLDYERMMANGLRVLEKAFAAPRRSLALRRLRRAVLSQYRADRGINRFQSGRYGEARHDLMRAVALDPRNLLYRNTAALLGACLFGAAAAGRLRALRRALGRRP